MGEGMESDACLLHVAPALAAALDEDHQVLHDQILAPEYLGRLQLARPGRDEVVEKEEALALCVGTLDPVARAVLLDRHARPHHGLARAEARGRGEGQARRGYPRDTVVGEAARRLFVGPRRQGEGGWVGYEAPEVDVEGALLAALQREIA